MRSARYPLMVTLFQRAFWFVFVIVALVAFAVAIPRLPSLGPDTRHLLVDTPVELTAASVTLPVSATERNERSTRMSTLKNAMVRGVLERTSVLNR